MQVVNLKTGLSESGFESGMVSAYVISESSGSYSVEIEGQVLTLTRAASCLIKPAPGDRVLCFVDIDNNSYIISVLETVLKDCTRLSVENNLVIETEDEDISMVSKNNINLATKNQLNFLSNEIIACAKKGLLKIDDLSLFSSKTAANITTGRVSSKQLEVVADHITQRFLNSFKFVENLDQIKAGNVMQSVKNLFSLKTRQAVVLADEDVKVDGERIHLG